MNVVIRVPNWLGDAIMSAYAIEAIKQIYNNPNITLVGREQILEFFKLDGYGYRFVADRTKDARFRVLESIKLGREVGKHDIAFSFTNSLLSALMLYSTGSTKRVGFRGELRSPLLTHPLHKERNHQAYEYLRLASFEQSEVVDIKSLNFKKEPKVKKSIIIAPGAAYGSSKRWGEAKFASLITSRDDLDFILVGAKSDSEVCQKIESMAKRDGAENLTNLCGKTSIKELVGKIQNAQIVISNDSGVMHLAAALKTEVVAIFGPTDERKTSIWDSTKNIVVKKYTKCAPCKHRVCPKPTHICMDEITTKDVLNAIDILEVSLRKNSIS